MRLNDRLAELNEQISDDLICMLHAQYGENDQVETVINFACEIVVDKLKKFQEENAIVPVIPK